MILKRRKNFRKNLPMRESMLMAIHHNHVQSEIHDYFFYFDRADREVLFDDDSSDKHGRPYDLLMRGFFSHGGEKETHQPLLPKKRQLKRRKQKLWIYSTWNELYLKGSDCQGSFSTKAFYRLRPLRTSVFL